MALEDNVVIAHFGDALAEDFPTVGGTQTNPSGKSDPTATGGALVFDQTDAITYTYGSDIWDPGTGDFTVAMRATINVSQFNSNVFWHLGTSAAFSNELMFRQFSGANRELGLTESYSGDEVKSNINVFTVGTPFTIVVHRSGDTWELYDGAGVSVKASQSDFGAGYNITASNDLTLGSEYDASGDLDADIDWIVFWDRALTTSELENNMNQTDLSDAILSGGGSALALLNSYYHG